MNKKNRKKAVIAILALIGTLVVVFAAVWAIERRQESRKQNQNQVQAESSEAKSEKKKKAEASVDNGWSSENTLYINDTMYGYDHRIETYLFIGTDASGNESGAGDEYHGAMADFLLLMVIDHTDDTYGFLQIDRGTVTEVPMITSSGELVEYSPEQICTAHWYGGNPVESAENTAEVVKVLIGELETLDGYYVLNMDQIGKLNASVDGVEVTIEDDLTSYDPDFKKGTTLTLSDEQAETFVRARYLTDDGKNAFRMVRQREYMNGFFQKAIAKMKEQPNFANTLWNTLKDAAVTDMNGNSFSRIAESVRKGESKGILSFEGETKEGTLLEDGELHEEFYPDQESIAAVMTELFSLVNIE